MKKLAVFPIKIYQAVISPLLGSNCRYYPTCSNYAQEAIEEWGISKGWWMALKRIVRCNPWGGHGIDQVPKNPKNQHDEK